MKTGTQGKFLSIFLASVMFLTIVMSSVFFVASCDRETDDYRQAQEVVRLIDAVLAIFDPNDPTSFNPNDRSALDEAIETAQDALHNLNPLYLVRVPNRGAIDEVIAALFELDANAAVQAVVGLINYLHQLMPLVYSEAADADAERAEFSTRLNAAQAAYAALAAFAFRGANHNIQARVSNRAHITTAQAQLAQFDTDTANAVLVQAVIALINAPVLIAGVSTANRSAFIAALDAAQDAYDDLDQALRSSVTNSYRLSELEAELLNYDRQVARAAAIDFVDARIAVLYALMPFEPCDCQEDPCESQEDRDAFIVALLQAQSAFDGLADFVFRNEAAVNLQGYVAYPNVIAEARIEVADDYLAVEAVIENIQYVIDLGDITTDNRADFVAALNHAQSTFDALTDNDQLLITNKGDLDILWTMLVDFDRAEAVAAAIAHVKGLINTLYDLMPLEAVYSDRAAFSAALINAQNAYNNIAEFIFREEDPISLQSYITNANVIETAVQQLNAVDLIIYQVQPFLNAGLARTNSTIAWTDIPFADNFTITYSYIPYGQDAIFIDQTQTVETNSFNFAATNHNRGFITNVSVVANIPAAILDGFAPSITLTTALSQTPSERKNETFLVSTANTTLAEAFRELIEENTYGANSNIMMAFLADTALGQVRNNAAARMTSSGRSFTAASPVNLNLNVGGETIVNFNQDGSTYESYKLILSNAYGTGVGSGAAQNIATLRDRTYFNAGQNLVQNHRIGHVGTIIASPIDRLIYDDTLEQWLARYSVRPDGFFGYIINPAYMQMVNTGNMGNSNDGSFLQLGITNRQPIAIANNQMTFIAVFNQHAGRLNRYDVMWSGGLANMSYRGGNYIALAFTICAISLNIVNYTTTSRYTANAIVNGDTRVRTTVEFSLYDQHQDMPWTSGIRNDPSMPANKPVPPTPGGGGCFVEGTLITMADGNMVVVEDIQVGDMVKVWNFLTGEFDIAPIFQIIDGGLLEREIVNLSFDNDVYLRFSYQHALFNLTLNRFIDLTPQNASSFIGHYFKYQYLNNGELAWRALRLDDVNLTIERVRVFVPMTVHHFSVYANGILTAPSDNEHFLNVFKVVEGELRYCAVFRQEMIDEFGLMTFEEFSEVVDFIPEMFFDVHRGQYINIAIGRGILCWDRLFYLFEKYADALLGLG